MTKKKIKIRPILELREMDKKIDEWIADNPDHSDRKLQQLEPPTQNTKSIPFSRFTVIMPEYLHRRIKKHCAVYGLSMKEKIIDILEKEFPET